MADLSFPVQKRSAEPITFTVGDDPHVYKFRPPKQAKMLLGYLTGEIAEDDIAVVMRKIFDWLEDGLSKADVNRIIKRLEDPKDDLDIEILQDILTKVMEHIGGRPTG